MEVDPQRLLALFDDLITVIKDILKKLYELLLRVQKHHSRTTAVKTGGLGTAVGGLIFAPLTLGVSLIPAAVGLAASAGAVANDLIQTKSYISELKSHAAKVVPPTNKLQIFCENTRNVADNIVETHGSTMNDTEAMIIVVNFLLSNKDCIDEMVDKVLDNTTVIKFAEEAIQLNKTLADLDQQSQSSQYNRDNAGEQSLGERILSSLQRLGSLLKDVLKGMFLITSWSENHPTEVAINDVMDRFRETSAETERLKEYYKSLIENALARQASAAASRSRTKPKPVPDRNSMKQLFLNAAKANWLKEVERYYHEFEDEPDVLGQALLGATTWVQREVAKFLLTSEGEIDLSVAISHSKDTCLHQIVWFNKWEFTPLQEAVKSDNDDNVDKVVDLVHIQEVNVNEQNNDGWTALHFACQFGNEDFVRILILAGADEDLLIYNDSGHRSLVQTAAEIALHNGHEGLLKFMIRSTETTE